MLLFKMVLAVMANAISLFCYVSVAELFILPPIVLVATILSLAWWNG